MFRNRHQAQLRDARGFTLIDTLATLAVFATVSAIALPRLTSSLEGQRLGIETRNVERELQAARLSAVAANRPIRIRFNCPSAGSYRRVELIGTVNTPDPVKDAETYTARCETNGDFPYPAKDQNPLTRPNNDGQTLQLNSTVAFTTVQTLEFWPDGSVHSPGDLKALAAPVTIGLVKGSSSKSIQVNSLGKIRIQ